jgi:hypothetical protein
MSFEINILAAGVYQTLGFVPGWMPGLGLLPALCAGREAEVEAGGG